MLVPSSVNVIAPLDAELAVTVYEPTPAVADTGAVEVNAKTGSAFAIVSVNVFDDICTVGVVESATDTVNTVAGSAAAGVPLNVPVPAENVNPVGSGVAPPTPNRSKAPFPPTPSPAAPNSAPPRKPRTPTAPPAPSPAAAR